MTATAQAQAIGAAAQQQISDILPIKASMTAGRKKMSTDLVFADMAARNIPLRTVPSNLMASSSTDGEGRIMVDIKCTVSAALLNQEAFPEPRPAYTTIQTTVYRLEGKKAVRRGRKHRQCPHLEPLGDQGRGEAPAA